MGSFIYPFKRVPGDDHPSEELSQRMEELFWRGGMMELEEAAMFGVKIYLLRREKIRKRTNYTGLSFCYNYFENDFWENAGFDAETGQVFSDKVGVGKFGKAVYAAYMLESLYSKAPLAPLWDGYLYYPSQFYEWLNYLFGEKYLSRTLLGGIWEFICYAHEHCPELLPDDSEYDVTLTDKDEWFVPYMVRFGTQAAIDKAKKELGGEIPTGGLYNYSHCTNAVLALRAFHGKSELPEEEQPEAIFAELEKLIHKEGPDKSVGADESIFKLFISCFISSPAAPAKAMSEIYGLDFWETYHRFIELFFTPDSQVVVHPLSTQIFMKATAAQMLPYMTEDDPLPEELEPWSSSLRKRFDELTESFTEPSLGLRDIFEMLEKADRQYRGTYAFADFFYESVTHLTEKKYQCLWKLFEEQLNAEDKEAPRKLLAVLGNPVMSRRVLGV